MLDYIASLLANVLRQRDVWLQSVRVSISPFMSKLHALKSASCVRDVAVLLGYSQASSLSYIVYKIPPLERYKTFVIPKSSGGIRTIMSPCDKLKELQRRLSMFLTFCLEEIAAERKVLDPKFKDTFSHGFKKKHSIMTNAIVHRNKRHVLNVDISDFFGTINFGRVRGFFLENRYFKLHRSVATLLAQISCHDNCLPQGAPTSPIISNLIGHILDVRLAGLAKIHGLHYSRYVDDLTFSTNLKEFPGSVARLKEDDAWEAGSELLSVIKRSGFSLNEKKTRLQYKNSRQDVTGLVVNSKINTPSEYRRLARAMAHRLFMSGSFERTTREIDLAGNVKEKKAVGTLDQLVGIFSYIVGVDEFERRRRKLGGLEVTSNLPMQKVFSDLLFYRFFYANEKPTIVCEGKTDIVYLRAAIRSRYADYPLLADLDKDGKLESKVSFFNCSSANARFLGLNGGADPLREFIRKFAERQNRFKAPISNKPVIVLVDNDSGAKTIYSLIKQMTASSVAVSGDQPFYYLTQKLYVVPTPKDPAGKDSKIEDLFPQWLLDTELKGKKFNAENVELRDHEYGKHYFAEYVVKPNKSKIDFSGFDALLSNLSSVCAR